MGNFEKSFTDSENTTIIVGAGLAGLATALKIKELDNTQEVTVIDKPQKQSNTQIAGQRFRAGISHKREDTQTEVLEVLAQQNDGLQTRDMETFSAIAAKELVEWPKKTGFPGLRDEKHWFGPQWGRSNSANNGRGLSVLRWLEEACISRGITVATSSVDSISIEDGTVQGLAVENEGQHFELQANNYVLANGSVGGSLFESTNRDISRSASEIAYSAGVPLTGFSDHMIHPFGRSSADGRHHIGCHETDALRDGDVYLLTDDGKKVHDAYITALLANNEAHHNFREICERLAFYSLRAVVILPDGSEIFTKMSHHYSHIGVDTEDGVKAKTVDNLYAAGDASSIHFWTEGQKRLPGFALSKCLVDAALIAKHIQNSPSNGQIHPIRETGVANAKLRDPLMRKRLKQINTKHLFKDFDSSLDTSLSWIDELFSERAILGGSALFELSTQLADTYVESLA